MSGWYIRRADKSKGPVSDAILRELARRGELRPSDLIWKEGMSSWVQAAKARGLFSAFKAADGTLSSLVPSDSTADEALKQSATSPGHAPPHVADDHKVVQPGHAPPHAAGHQATSPGHAPPPTAGGQHAGGSAHTPTTSGGQAGGIKDQLGSLIDNFADMSKKILPDKAAQSASEQTAQSAGQEIHKPVSGDASRPSGSGHAATGQPGISRPSVSHTPGSVQHAKHPDIASQQQSAKRPSPVSSRTVSKPPLQSRLSALSKGMPDRKSAVRPQSGAGLAQRSVADNYTAMLISQYDQAKKGKHTGKPVYIPGKTLQEYEKEGLPKSRKVLAYLGMSLIILFALGMTTYSLAFMPDKQGLATVVVECIKCGHQQVLPTDKLSYDSMGRQCTDCPNCGSKKTAFLAMQCPNCGKYFISEADKVILAKSGSMYSKTLNCPHCNTNPVEWNQKHRKK